MKLGLVAVAMVAACAAPNSPKQPISPLPPDRPVPEDATVAEPAPVAPTANADPGSIAWPVYPTIGAVPASKPTGDPITVQSPTVKVGDKHHRVIASTFEQHFIHDKDTRYQLTKRDFDLDVAVQALDHGHAARLEVVAHTANEWVALADAPTTAPRQNMPLLKGTYIVTADSVVRDGNPVSSRETEELGGLFGAELGASDPTLVFLRSKRLRLGEVVALSEADKKTLGGGRLIGKFTLGVIAADAGTVTYQMDVDATGAPGTMTEKATIRMRATIKLDRASGFLLTMNRVTHKVDKGGDALDDTFASETTTYSR